MFRRTFLDSHFPRERREAKGDEFFNLRQGGMSVQDYSMMFTKLFKYDPSLVSNSWEEISRFVADVSNECVEQCRSVMLHDNTYISRLMVHAQQVEDT